MNDYEAKQEAKRQRYEELAEKNRKASAARYKGVQDICDRIPFGQPILVGHHSEAHARADQKRIDTGMRASIDHQEKADYYANKADNVGKGGISSDDPEAIDKLREKLAKLEEAQAYMKRINKIHREYKKNPASIDKHELTEKEREHIINYVPQYSWIPSPFAPYQMQNNNGNMKRIRDRIEQLEKASEREHKEVSVGEITLVQNTEENRIQILFPGKPNEKIRKLLKSHGFRWSPTNKAWQRQLNNNGIYAAQTVGRAIRDDFGGEWQ